MKKVLILLGCLFIITGCSNQKEMTISLIGNPTTGYEWTTNYSKNFLILKSNEYFSSSSKLVGASGTYEFKFTPKKSGETTVIFNYSRSFEEVEPIYTIYYKIKIDDKKRISFISKSGTYSEKEIPDPVIK